MIVINKVKIFTDSACDLSQELIEKHNISVIPFYVTLGEKTFLDGKNITTDELYELVSKYKKLPKTGAPNPRDYYEAFRPFVEDGFQIIYIGLSSRISSALENARIAARKFKDGAVRIVDSLNLSTGIGLLVLKAVDLVKEGKDADEIVKILEDIIPNIKTSFIIDRFDYLYMGGRCSGLQKFIGNIFKFNIRIKVEKGEMFVAQRVRGNKKKVFDSLFSELLREQEYDQKRIFITHSHQDEGAFYLKNRLTEIGNFKNVLVTEAGSVISSHCGPGTVGVLYISRKKGA